MVNLILWYEITMNRDCLTVAQFYRYINAAAQSTVAASESDQMKQEAITVPELSWTAGPLAFRSFNF